MIYYVYNKKAGMLTVASDTGETLLISNDNPNFENIFDLCQSPFASFSLIQALTKTDYITYSSKDDLVHLTFEGSKPVAFVGETKFELPLGLISILKNSYGSLYFSRYQERICNIIMCLSNADKLDRIFSDCLLFEDSIYSIATSTMYSQYGDEIVMEHPAGIIPAGIIPADFSLRVFNRNSDVFDALKNFKKLSELYDLYLESNDIPAYKAKEFFGDEENLRVFKDGLSSEFMIFNKEPFEYAYKMVADKTKFLNRFVEALLWM